MKIDNPLDVIFFSEYFEMLTKMSEKNFHRNTFSMGTYLAIKFC